MIQKIKNHIQNQIPIQQILQYIKQLPILPNQMNETNPSKSYKINQIDNLIADVNNRAEMFSTFSSILEQRVKIQFQYAEKLKALAGYSLGNSGFFKDSSLPSQKLISNLRKIIEKQSQNHEKLAQQLNDQVCRNVKQQLVSLEAQNKRNLTVVKSLKKDLQSQCQTIQKNKSRFYKKSTELQKLKIQYINSILLQERDFQKKNKLFLKIKQLQAQSSPLRKIYQTTSNKYGEYLSISVVKFSQIFKKIQDKQHNAVKCMKNNLINSQLFNQALGAIMVHETQMILSQLGDICIQQAEIKKHTFRQLQQQKVLLECAYINPSEYVQQLFKKIQQNTIQDIIKYGKDVEYKKQLNQFFQDSNLFYETNNVKVINDYTLRIIQIFRSIFQGKQYSNSTFIQFRQLITAKPSLRKDFIFCLQKYRLDGKFKIHKQNFNHIIQLLNIFLDICCLELDTYNSKQFMVLSFTYYLLDENENKIDLQFFVKSHRIWHNLKWWECSLLQSIYQQHKIKKKKTESNPQFSLWDIKSASMKKADSSEQNSTITNICFNQLAYYVHNMQLFDMNSNQINIFAQKYIKIFGFNSKMTNDITNMYAGSLNGQEISPTKSNH